MDSQLIDKQPAEATIKVTVPAAEVDETYEAVLRNLSRRVRVPGFRPGRAPRGVLLQRIGKEAVAEEVRDALIDRHYPEAVRKHELAPVHAHFHGEMPHEGSDYVFEVHVDLLPEFELPDLSEIVIDTEARAVDDEMIARAVEQLRRENATLVPVERPVEPGDYLLVETIDDQGEGSGLMPFDLENVEDALAEQLLGKSAGDEVELVLVPPAAAEEATDEEAASAPPPLRIRIVDVKEKEKPEPDDAFAKTLGFESWDEVLEQVRQSLQAQLDQEAFEAQREEFLEKLLAEAEFEVPKSLVNNRKLTLLENLAGDLAQRGVKLEEYFATLEEKGTREEFDRELEEAAVRGVRRDLLLEKLVAARGTRISDEEFDQAVRHLAAREGKDVQRFRRERGEQWLENYRYLLTRDRALREAVLEAVGQGGEAEPAENAGAGTDSAGDETAVQAASEKNDGGQEDSGQEDSGQEDSGQEESGQEDGGDRQNAAAPVEGASRQE